MPSAHLVLQHASLPTPVWHRQYFYAFPATASFEIVSLSMVAVSNALLDNITDGFEHGIS